MRRRGFTLVEVLVALTLAAIAASVAVGAFTTLSDSVRFLGRAVERTDREANARAWMREVFASMELGSGDERDRFAGHEDEVAFTSTVWGGDGSRGRSRVRVAFQGDGLVAEVPGQRPLDLATELSGGGLEYLLDYGSEATFLGRWESEVSLPVAVRLHLERDTVAGPKADTLLFWVGGARR